MEEKETEGGPAREIIRINIMQTSMNLGTKLGLCMIGTYILFLAMLKAPLFALLTGPAFLGIPVAAFFLILTFRNRNCRQFFPFPVAWMISIMTFLFATVLSCMAAYLYLRFIDSGSVQAAMSSMFSQAIETMGSVEGVQPEMIQAQEQYSQWFAGMTPLTLTRQLAESQLLWGNILSLVIGIATARRPKTGIKQQ